MLRANGPVSILICAMSLGAAVLEAYADQFAHADPIAAAPRPNMYYG
ncbi:MAG TPA: hypothetical protein VNF47_10255 [Streptosporangiaceae bacterium]|nr:hypothetical protein [Streptosporangiaceae bacterium]